jgi:hypothetical protein
VRRLVAHRHRWARYWRASDAVRLRRRDRARSLAPDGGVELPKHGRVGVRFDPSHALSMVQALKARGVRVEEQPITARWNDRMTTLLHTSLRD